MRKSEIFDEFAKIAQEKGLLSDDSKKKLEKNPRADSLSISDIEALYDVKPNTPKGMEYKKNIIEDAHPNPVVVSPSYDKLNGLVENLNERQNIILNIVNKQNNGHLTQHKYARKELLLSLVRIANDLDNKDQEKLYKLADHCIAQVSMPIRKEAALPAVVPYIAGVVIVLGALWAQQHLRFASDGLEADHKKLIAEIDDLLESNSDWGVGYKYKPQFIQQMTAFKNKLNEFYNAYMNAMNIIDAVNVPRDAKEIFQMAAEPDNLAEINNAYNTARNAFFKLEPMIQSVLRNFKSEFYKQRQIEEKGFLSSVVDKTQILHGGKGLVADDFDDVRRALEAYYKDIEEVAKELQVVETKKQTANSQLSNARAKTQQLFGDKPSAAQSAQPQAVPQASPQATPRARPSNPEEGLEQQLSEFEQSLNNLGQ